MQKLTVDAGFSCPNRDGTVGRGGCAYCNNASFSPLAAAKRLPIEEQLEQGKQFFARKYPDMRFMAYFQSYTSTHGDKEQLLKLYRQALAVPKVDALIIGTRPDCVDLPLLQALARLGKPVFMEYGAESTHNQSLERVNRCHTWEQTCRAVDMTRRAGLPVGLHFIMGLPGETEQMMLQSAERAAELHLDTIKFHQLQIIKGTQLARLFALGKLTDATLFTPGSYAELCIRIIEIMTRLSPETAIERFTASAPADMLVAPRWGLKNYEFTNLLKKHLLERNT